MRDTHPIMLEKRIFNLEENGGGSGGTTDYEDLENKPKINNVELIGNVDLSDLGAASTEDVGQIVDDLSDLEDKVGDVPEGETVEGQISSINSNLTNFLEMDYDNIIFFNTLTYTAPNDGMICLFAQCTGRTYGYIKINEKIISSYVMNDLTRINFQINVKKNDVITVIIGEGSILLKQGVGSFTPFKNH